MNRKGAASMTGAFGRRDPDRCRSGLHEWTPENIEQKADGNWQCRLCTALRRARTRASKRARDPVPVGRKIPVAERIPCTEVLAEFEMLCCSVEEAARRMNMTQSALERALQRARKKRELST